MSACVSCRFHRVRFFPSPGSPDGVAGAYSDRCMRLAKAPDDPETIGWSTMYETMEAPGRCGPERVFFEAKP